MIKTKIKLLILFLFTTLNFNNIAFGLDVIPDKQGDTKLLNSIVSEYEKDNLPKLNRSGILELKQIKLILGKNKLPSSFSKKVIENRFRKMKFQDINKSLKGKISANFETSVAKKLKESVVNGGNYRFIVKSKYSLQDLKLSMQAIDRFDIEFLYSDALGYYYYNVKFNNSSILGGVLKSHLENGLIPTTIFEGVEVIQPFYVKTTYLSGESLSKLRGITKISADKYQQGLSSKNKVKVGVIDTGIDYTHADLQSNLNVNSGEIIGNGKDDDNNGYIDDVYGYNFVLGNSDANDDHGHGTHVAGIIAGVVNGNGIFGVNSNASLVSLKVLDASGYGSSYGIIDAINYASNNGIKVLNMSLGGDGIPSESNPLCAAITNAKSKGVISVVAAGNENQDVSGKIPGGCANAITVAAVDSNLSKASFSNYGTKVELAAPGVSIYSTYYLNRYATMNGTSMATPFVAGLVSSVLANNPDYNTDSMRTLLLNNSDTLTATNIGKFINMKKVMDSIGVAQDGVVVNIPPSLELISTNLTGNDYKVEAFGTDIDGTITDYYFFADDNLVFSGGNIYETTITKDTTILVQVKDNSGAITSKSVLLKYNKPSNILPSLSLTSRLIDLNNYHISVDASDTDGQIVYYEYLVNGILYKSGSGLNQLELIIDQNTLLKVIVYDNEGGTADESIELVYEKPANSNPILNLTSEKLSGNNYLVHIDANDLDGNIVDAQFFLNGLNVYSGELIQDYEVLISENSIFQVIVYDNDGGTAQKAIDLIYEKPANILPSLEISYKKNSLNNYTINTIASDSDGTIVNYEYYINGVLSNSGTNLTSYTFNIIENSLVIVKVYDNEGGVAEKLITLIYEKVNQPPLLNLTSTKVSTNKFTISIDAKDIDGTIVKYQIYVNGKLKLTSTTNKSYTLSISKNTIVKVRVTDNSGAYTEKSITLVYEKPNVTPKLSLRSTKLGKGNYIVYANATDSDGYIASYEYYLNGNLITSGSNIKSYNYKITKTSYILVKVKDNKGAIAQKSIRLSY